jgi:tape measure domain-containing protein
MSKVKTQLVIEGENSTKRMFREVDDDLTKLDKKLQRAGRSLVAAFSLSAITGVIRSISNTSDAYNLMNARLKLATETQEEFNKAQVELQRIATDTQSPVESLVTLYSRIARPLREVGRSQEDILKVTEAVATSFRISGASAQEAENGVIQFAQALGSGALRGDEFNSVAEQAPRLMQALADSIGVPIGALKDMAAEGRLTASIVTDALVGSLDQLRAEAATLPDTVGGAMTQLTDKVNSAIGKADITPLTEAINNLGETLTDPAVIEGLTNITAGMITLAGWTATVASEFSTFAKNVGETATAFNAPSSELVQELETLEKTLSQVRAAQTGSSFMGASTPAKSPR